MSPADDALVVLFEAAVSSSDLITFTQFILRAAVALAARVEALDVLLLEPLVGIAVVVPIVKHESSRRSELDFFHAEHSPHVHSTVRVDLDDLPGVELRRAFTTEVGLALVALAELFTAAFWAPAARARAAARAAPVASLLPRAPVRIRISAKGFDVLGLEVLIRISVVIPVWRSTSEIGYPEHNCETFVNLYAIEQTQLHEQRRVESGRSEI